MGASLDVTRCQSDAFLALNEDRPRPCHYRRSDRIGMAFLVVKNEGKGLLLARGGWLGQG